MLSIENLVAVERIRKQVFIAWCIFLAGMHTVQYMPGLTFVMGYMKHIDMGSIILLYVFNVIVEVYLFAKGSTVEKLSIFLIWILMSLLCALTLYVFMQQYQ